MSMTIEKTFKIGKNGLKYIPLENVRPVFHMTDGNSKTGKAGNFNFPIELTCRHDCECYNKKNCYACQGCYLFLSNQTLYSENLKWYLQTRIADFVKTVSEYIQEMKLEIVRYFTCGDIPNSKFLDCVNETAKANPKIRFWLYTKKYGLVNKWIDENGLPAENLVIIFSHWMNEDGTYLPMENPHNLPTSEFIPFGKEELTETVTHICPCSDHNIKTTCHDCDHPCYLLKAGQSMALLEHSTKRTKERDKAIREAHKKL